MAKRYAGTNAKTPVNLVVKNKGAKTINSLELTYTVDDAGDTHKHSRRP